MKEKMKFIKQWMKINRIVLAYIVAAVSIELVSVFIVEDIASIQKPSIEYGLLGAFTMVMFAIKKNRIRTILGALLLGVQSVLDISCIVIYNMTGQHFEYAMLSLRNDAFGILEKIEVDFVSFYTALAAIVIFLIYSARTTRRNPSVEHSVREQKIYQIVAIFFFALSFFILWDNNVGQANKYEKMVVDKNTSNYSGRGIVGTIINELIKGKMADRIVKMPSEEIEDFLYQSQQEPTSRFGVASDNNVIVILAESLEWFSFIKSEEYPNGLDIDEKDIAYLFPNLTRLYKESVVMSNFHSKEKTDISETLSILGSYPTSAYIAYDFSENVMPHTIPNLLKTMSDTPIQVRSFHDGTKNFYNRKKTHISFGFDKFYSSYEMYQISNDLVKSGQAKEATMYDYLGEGERNLDSEMIQTCKDEMFPADKRFYTYITTITMHGMYYERENLKQYQEKLRSVYTAKDTEQGKIFENYLTTAMDLDRAIGLLMEDLEKKGILDKTTIVIFGDHNAYYQKLSNYVKNIENYETEQYYTDLYKVPLMIYNKNLEPQTIDKFTCTADIAPTILDLLGIRTYENMYYGTSVFSEKESVLYSRAYGIFVGKGIVRKSLNQKLYQSDTVTQEQEDYFHTEAEKLVERIKYCDQIFYQDYFADEKNYQTFIDKMKEIQKKQKKKGRK